jgi:hypothetical protein
LAARGRGALLSAALAQDQADLATQSQSPFADLSTCRFRTTPFSTWCRMTGGANALNI